MVVRSKYENWLTVISGRSSSWQKHVLCHNSEFLVLEQTRCHVDRKRRFSTILQIIFITQTKVCGKREHIRHKKKKKSWSFVTFMLGLVVRHSVNPAWRKTYLTCFLAFHFASGEDDQSCAFLHSWEAHLWYWIVSKPLSIKIKRIWAGVSLWWKLIYLNFFLFIFFSFQTVDKPNKHKAAVNAELYCSLSFPIRKINVTRQL